MSTYRRKKHSIKGLGVYYLSSSSKLKPIFFTSGGNSISYVRIVVLLNGVGLRSSSHGINFSRYEL